MIAACIFIANISLIVPVLSLGVCQDGRAVASATAAANKPWICGTPSEHAVHSPFVSHVMFPNQYLAHSWRRESIYCTHVLYPRSFSLMGTRASGIGRLHVIALHGAPERAKEHVAGGSLGIPWTTLGHALAQAVGRVQYTCMHAGRGSKQYVLFKRDTNIAGPCCPLWLLMEDVKEANWLEHLFQPAQNGVWIEPSVVLHTIPMS